MTIDSDKRFIEQDDFNFSCGKYKIKLFNIKGPHCKEIKIYKTTDTTRIILVVAELSVLRDLFYMGDFLRNIRRYENNNDGPKGHENF